MAIVRIKTKEQKVNELLNMFKLPCVDYSKGYQSKPRSEPMGGSAVNSVEAARLNAVNELRRWARESLV